MFIFVSSSQILVNQDWLDSDKKTKTEEMSVVGVSGDGAEKKCSFWQQVTNW